MKQKAEEIYHRFVNYEWNDVGEGLKKSILEAIETALKEGQKLPIHSVSQQSEQLFCKCGSVKNGGYGCMRTDCDNTLQAFMQNNCG